MPRTPDSKSGPSFEEGTYYSDFGVATEEGEVRYTGDRFSYYDSTGEYDPRTGGDASLLGKAVFKIDGGLVYTSSGDVVIKANQ